MSVRCGNRDAHHRNDVVKHFSAQEVRNCYAESRERRAREEWEAEVVYCSICDGQGHGQPGYGPCPLEMTGADETYRESLWDAARGL